MARRRRTRDLTARKGPRIKERRADEIRKGDILWSDVSGRLFVFDVYEVEVEASGNLLAAGTFDDGGTLAQEDDPDKPKVKAIVIVVRRQTDGSVQMLGAYAPRTMLKTVRSAD